MFDEATTGYVVGGAGVLLAIGQIAWQKFFSTEGKTNDSLIQQLGDRIAAQELRLSVLETGLDAERAARRVAENKVHALEIDNLLLRAELRRHGIDVTDPLSPIYTERHSSSPAADPPA